MWWKVGSGSGFGAGGSGPIERDDLCRDAAGEAAAALEPFG